MTRCASTWVLPEPALADTQTEFCGIGGARLPVGRLVGNRIGLLAHSSAPSSGVAARRPFEHAGEMVVVAVGLALAERQRPRQIAGFRIAVVDAAALPAAPRPPRKARRRSWPCGCARGSIRRTPRRSASAARRRDRPARRLPSSRNAPRFSSAPSSASCGASSVCACAFRRRRAGLVVENVGHAGRQQIDAVGIAGKRDARCRRPQACSARASGARRCHGVGARTVPSR